MNAQHTPGPWIVDATPSHCPCVFMVRAKANKCDAWVPVADCSGHLDSAANARLIAASPDLLAACQALLRHCVCPAGFPDKDKGRTADQQAAFDQARQAIAKASQP